MILERSKTDAVLQTGSAPKGTIYFMKEFVKPIPANANALPRLSNKSTLAERPPSSISVEALPTTVAAAESPRSNVNATGLTVKTQQVDDGGSTMTPLLSRRSRAMVTFHCSPFETGAVRVAVSAPTAPQIKNGASALIHSTPYGWVPPIVTAAPELPSRLEPIHPLPPAPQRQHTSWETIDGHWRNDQRALIMRRLQHINSNEMLAKMYYGTREEIDGYKKHMRGILKEQMDEQWIKSRKRFHLDLSESNAAIEYDRECLREDQRADWQKRMYLRQFAHDNRQLAEERRQRLVQDHAKELEHERRLLAYNPINWSGTLT